MECKSICRGQNCTFGKQGWTPDSLIIFALVIRSCTFPHWKLLTDGLCVEYSRSWRDCWQVLPGIAEGRKALIRVLWFCVSSWENGEPRARTGEGGLSGHSSCSLSRVQVFSYAHWARTDPQHSLGAPCSAWSSPRMQLICVHTEYFSPGWSW